MNLDKFATDQILPNVRKELEEYGDIRDGCLCFTGFSPDGRPSFAILDNASASFYLYYKRVSGLARSVRASKVLSVVDTTAMAFPESDKTIVIRLILPDGSVEWTMSQSYRRNGKRFTWDEPEKDGWRLSGFSSRLGFAWGYKIAGGGRAEVQTMARTRPVNIFACGSNIRNFLVLRNPIEAADAASPWSSVDLKHLAAPAVQI